MWPLTVSVALALALGATTGVPAESKKQITALAPRTFDGSLPPTTPTAGSERTLLGDSTKGGDWIDRVRISGARESSHTRIRMMKSSPSSKVRGTWGLASGSTRRN